MMEDGDGHGSSTFHYNQLLSQQDMLMQPPFISSSAFNPTYGENPFLILQPPSYPYGCTYSDEQLYMSSGNLTDDQETLFASSSLSGNAGRSSVLSSMLSNEFEKMKSSMNVLEDKALAASRNHSEAERRRRERINSHLSNLRNILPNTTKTNKASLLAEVIQRVKYLKQQTSALPELNAVPTDFDELTFETCTNEYGKLVIKASLCCDDRSDILQDLIKACEGLHLRTVKADIATFAGRMKYVVFIAGDPDEGDGVASQAFIRTVQEAFESVMGRSLRKLDNEEGAQLDPCLKRRRVKESSLRAI